MDAHSSQGGLALGIDFGTSHTVAVVRRPDGRISPLLFDGSPLLPSAVYAETDGVLVVGRDALHSGRRSPERLEPNPKRAIDSDTVLLGEQEFRVADVIAAVLRRVGEECGRVAGVPTRTTITVPAAWGPTRRQVVSDAADAAGIGPVLLAAEPVAAATYFAESLGHRVPAGSSVVVYDFGAGTFDASVVARRSEGFEVLAVDGRDDLGGLDLDLAIVAHIGRQFADEPDWRRLVEPTTSADRRHRRALFEEVRIAKERLSRYQSADIAVPLLDVDTHVTREELEEATRPLVTQAVRVTQGVIRAAGLTVEQTAGVFLVGGASRMPLVATMLHQELGVAPTAIEQPELVVAEGSVLASAGGGSLPPAASPANPAVSPAPAAVPPPLPSPQHVSSPAPTTPQPSPVMPMAVDPTPQQSGPQPPATQPMTQPTMPQPVMSQGDPTQPLLAPPAPPGAPQQTGWSSTRKLVTGITAGFAALVLLAVVLAALNRPDDPDQQTTTGLQDDMSDPAVDVRGGEEQTEEPAYTDTSDQDETGGVVAIDDIANARMGDQLGQPIANHTHAINNIEFAVIDGRTAVLTASDDHTVGIWDLETGESLGKFSDHGGRVLDVAIMDFKDGPLAVSRDDAYVVKVWDLKTQKEIRSVDTAERPRGERFGYHQGTPVAVGASMNRVGYWDLETGELMVDHNDYGREFISEFDTVTVDGRVKVIASSTDYMLRIVDVHSGDEEGNAFAPHPGYIRGTGHALIDGKPVAVTSESDVYRVWDLETREQIGVDLEKAVRDRFRGEIFERDGTTLLICGGDQRSVRVWDVATGEQVGPNFNGHDADVTTVELAELKDTTIAVSASNDGTVRRWSLGS